MKKRTTFKRMLSGIMAAMTLFTTVLSPISAAAAPEPKEKEPPAYEQVKEQLSADEVVTAKDYELLAGTAFDVETDLTGLEIVDETKVKVKLYEAKNESGEDFSTSHADTYKAVYYVEPLSGHPVYQIQRNLIVKEPESQTVSENTAGTQESAGHTPTVEESEEEEPEPERVDVPDVTEEPELQEETEQTEETGTEQEEIPATDIPETMVPETEIRSEEELNAALEAAKEQDTVDEETGLTLGEVWNQMIEGDVDIFSMEEGETITFTAYSQKKARSTDVEVTNGEWYYYADYGLGTYVTQPFTVKFGSVTATAYCIEPSKPGPGSGVYEITKLGGGKELAKVCYYGTGASGSYNFYEKKHPDFSEGKRFVVTHLAASYANGSSDAFYG
ncbi:thioester domain-containing protein, partial [Waltera sp.]|uniref:thioester domain-containing protein n=1 Tax=Waltera sp. TaxID=2815806 RepID=UPI003AF0C47E